MAGIIPAQVTEPSYPGPIAGGFDPAWRWQPNKCDGRAHPNPLGRVHPGPREWQMEHMIMAQRYRGVALNLSQKEGVDIWRSTDGQTPKKEGVDIWEVQTAKPQKGRSWYLGSTGGQTLKRKEFIFNKDTDEQSQPIRKEPMRATLVRKEKNWSSNTNGPQIIIIGPFRS